MSKEQSKNKRYFSVACQRDDGEDMSAVVVATSQDDAIRYWHRWCADEFGCGLNDIDWEVIGVRVSHCAAPEDSDEGLIEWGEEAEHIDVHCRYNSDAVCFLDDTGATAVQDIVDRASSHFQEEAI